MGGEISAASVLGKGSDFTVILPLVIADSPENTKGIQSTLQRTRSKSQTNLNSLSLLSKQAGFLDVNHRDVENISRV